MLQFLALSGDCFKWPSVGLNRGYVFVDGFLVEGDFHQQKNEILLVDELGISIFEENACEFPVFLHCLALRVVLLEH